jgi:hypothetical protein
MQGMDQQHQGNLEWGEVPWYNTLVGAEATQTIHAV